MAAETVKFFLTDQDTNPILGVLVRVFDATGTTFITQDTTVGVGGDAVAEVALDGDDPPNEYTIRMSKTGVAFDGNLGDDSKSPQLIEIYSPASAAPTGKNDFNIRGETFVRPVATDARLCRASGFFKDAGGRPLPNLDIKMINQFRPAIVDGNAVLGERLEMRTDADGYLELDLYRNGEYLAWVQSIQAAEADPASAISFSREIVVPDVSSVNIVDLLFPIVSEITFSEDPVTLNVDEDDEVTTVVKASDGRILIGTAHEDVLYASADPTIASLRVEADKLVIHGEAAGSTEITATRQDQTVVTIPSTTITGSPLSVTVS